MSDHRIQIMTGGAIDPATLAGVNASDEVTIANQSGTGAKVTYPTGANPFSDIKDGTSETLPDGGDIMHMISAEFDPSAMYDIWVALEDSLLETSQKIRITGGGKR